MNTTQLTPAIDFVGESGLVVLSELFRDKQTLAVYSYMYGRQRALALPDVMAAFAISGAQRWDLPLANQARRAPFSLCLRMRNFQRQPGI